MCRKGCVPSRGAPLPVVGSIGSPSVKVARLTRPAAERAAKAAQRRVEARIIAGRKRMNTHIFDKG